MFKKILVSEDLSCFGQVSLTTAIPLLSASGLNVSVLPTALLSTHTGGFGNNTYLDLSLEMTRIIRHWHELNLSFDAIYLGYLGIKSLHQWQKSLSSLKSSRGLVLLDPVMGDYGQLYQGFDQNYVQEMRSLINQADVLTPNLTEASLLLGEPQLLFGGVSEAKQAASKLQARFHSTAVIITGIPASNKQIAVVGQERNKKHPWLAIRPSSSTNFFGTGDLFAAGLLSGLLNECSPENAANASMDLIKNAISQRSTRTDRRVGLNYSAALPHFLQQISQGGYKNA